MTHYYDVTCLVQILVSSAGYEMVVGITDPLRFGHNGSIDLHLIDYRHESGLSYPVTVKLTFTKF